jgi:hypothetical protein
MQAAVYTQYGPPDVVVLDPLERTNGNRKSDPSHRQVLQLEPSPRSDPLPVRTSRPRKSRHHSAIAPSTSAVIRNEAGRFSLPLSLRESVGLRSEESLFAMHYRALALLSPQILQEFTLFQPSFEKFLRLTSIASNQRTGKQGSNDCRFHSKAIWECFVSRGHFW